jgi:tyrosyl-tRNA synthetase
MPSAFSPQVSPVNPTADDLISAMQEVVMPDELGRVLGGDSPTGYIGIEPSGLLTTAQAFQIARSLTLLHQAGVHMTVLLADWHAYINDKLEGDLDRIKRCGAYLQEALTTMGVDPGMTKYVYASEFAKDDNYWELVVRTLKASSLNRIKRALTIMGREEDESELDSSKIIYPAMQVSDIYYLDVDIALGGMDQRKAHMLCRDVAGKIGKDVKTPVALHFALLPSLTGGSVKDDPVAAKMSKSRPESALLIHDTPEEIDGKLKRAFCPAGELEDNPVTELARLIIMPALGELTISRPEKWGGDMHFTSYDLLAESFESGQLHPADLKAGVANALAELQRPVREHFESDPIHKEFIVGP